MLLKKTMRKSSMTCVVARCNVRIAGKHTTHTQNHNNADSSWRMRINCQCTTPQVERYMSKISGPLLDRIDMHLEVSAVPFSDLESKQEGTSSAVIRSRVCIAREIQQNRFRKSGTAGHRWNAHMTTREIRHHCHIEKRST